jgi:hypothetical protein
MSNYTRLSFWGVFLLGIGSSFVATAQGLLLNEVSNGATGTNQEFVEMIVMGDPLLPLAPVDLRGWILDDNNGSFLPANGVAPGHFRISTSCTALSTITPGSIIVVYNAADRNPALPADDLTDSNGDKVYIIPHTSTCIQGCATLPTGANPAYSPCTYSTPVATDWINRMAFATGGDAAQTRRPDGSLFSGFAYGSVSTTFPSMSANVGGGNSFSVELLTGSNRAYQFGCGAYTSVNVLPVGATTNQSPGASNNTNNTSFIQNITNGTFNYSDFANPSNCGILLPMLGLGLEASPQDAHTLLTWHLEALEQPTALTLQVSEDGVNFQNLADYAPMVSTEPLTKNYLHTYPKPLQYYRLQLKENSGKIYFSELKVVQHLPNEMAVLLYPNPVKNQLFVRFNQPTSPATIVHIYDMLGRLVTTQSQTDSAFLITIPTETLPSGTYLLQIQSATFSYSKTFLK